MKDAVTSGGQCSYDVFISYAHEDVEAAAWLADYLRSTWVPGKRRRRVFRDATHLTAGGLSETLRRNLLSSRFLVVCCSEAAARSPWVNLEIDEFAHARAPGHGTRDILACQTGNPQSPIVLPPALVWVQRELDDELYLPDLRGKRRGSEAAAILAPIVGLKSREDVFAVVRKRRLTLIVSFTLVFTLGLSGLLSWNRWLSGPAGSFYATTNAVLDLTPNREIVDLRVLWAVRALARQDQRSKIDRLAQFIPEREYHSIVVASGLASLPNPDCQGAAAQLRPLDAAAAKAWPAGNLLVYKACGGDWLARIEESDRKADSLPAWFDRLAETGNLQKAESLVDLPTYPKSAVLEARAKLAMASRTDTIYSQANLLNWANGGDALDILYRALQLLRGFDLNRRLSDPLAQQLLQICNQATSHLRIEQYSNWNLFGQLAAYLAGASNASSAVKLLGLPPPADSLGNPGWAPGWAWRGLAYHRLGREQEAGESFERVQRCLRTVVPASRSYDENSECAAACVLADRWTDAFRTTGLVGNDQMQILQRCQLIALWVDRGGQVPWPWKVYKFVGLD